MKDTMPIAPLRFRKLLFMFFVLLLLLLSWGSYLIYYIPPSYTVLFHWLGLLMPGLVLLDGLLLILGFFRNIRYAICGGLALLGCGHYFPKVLQFNSQQFDTVADVRIATFNVHEFKMLYDMPSADHIADFVDANQVNLLCLQEVPSNYSMQQLKKTFPGLPYQVRTTDSSGNNHLAVLSKYPIEFAKTISFHNRPNGILVTDLLINQQKLRVLNCHLQTTGWNQIRHKINFLSSSVFDAYKTVSNNVVYRAQQASALSKIVSDSPYAAVVCGDLNAQPVSYTYHTVKGNLKDAFCEAGHGYSYTYKYFMKLYRIDFVLFSGIGLKALNYYTGDLPYSDHLPVVVDFKFL